MKQKQQIINHKVHWSQLYRVECKTSVNDADTVKKIKPRINEFTCNKFKKRYTIQGAKEHTNIETNSIIWGFYITIIHY